MNQAAALSQKTEHLEREIIALQEHVMHQEQMLDALNSVIIEQQQQIDFLTKQLESLKKSIEQQISSPKDSPQGFSTQI